MADQKRPEVLSVSELRRLYWDDELSLPALAERFGVHSTTVLQWMKNWGIPRRSLAAANAVARSRWRGGETMDKGYVLVWQPLHLMANCNGYVRRSHLVWEKHTGHVVQPGEVVHHVNGVRDDDRFENLRLMTNAEHARLHRLMSRNGGHA